MCTVVTPSSSVISVTLTDVLAEAYRPLTLIVGLIRWGFYSFDTVYHLTVIMTCYIDMEQDGDLKYEDLRDAIEQEDETAVGAVLSDVSADQQCRLLEIRISTKKLFFT